MPSRNLFALSAIALTLVVGRSAFAAAKHPVDDTAFQRIVDALETKRTERHIPGMTLVVVSEGEPARIHCFGQRDTAKELPVTPDTLFSLASTSKTFTAVLAATVVADGRLSFDDPVSKHLDYFKLFDPDASSQCTLRDLMSHRTGLTRTDALLGGKDITRRELVEQLAKAEPSKPFRKAFQYNNQMFLVAALATANAAAAPGQAAPEWEALLKQRLFDPLGMTHTTPFLKVALADSNMSSGYTWDDDTSKLILTPTNGIELCAPAGGLYTTGNDLAKWLTFLASRGKAGDTQLLALETLDKLFTQNIEVVPGSGMGYGMGFFTREWLAHKIYEHGGNLDGFSTQLSFMPTEGVGYALLMNNAATTLPEESRDIVYDAILSSPAAKPADAALAPELAKYLGCYLFAPTKGTWFVVAKDGGKLGLDVPGQRIYTLSEPDKDDKRTIVELPIASLRFETGDDGAVKSISFFQNGKTLPMPRMSDQDCDKAKQDRAASKLPPGDPIPAAQLESYTGAFFFELAKQTWEVQINQQGKLAVDVPGQTLYALKWPTAKGRWVFELTDAIEIAFEKDDQGNVTHLICYQAGQTFKMPRAKPPTDLPSKEEILALTRKAVPLDAASKINTMTASGRMRMPNQGLEGAMTCAATKDGRFRVTVDFGRFGTQTAVWNGTRGYSETSATGRKPMEQSEADLFRLQNPITQLEDWSQRFTAIRPLPKKKIGDLEAIAVRVTPKRGETSTLYLDPNTGDTIRDESSLSVKAIAFFSITTDSSDFRDIGGVRIPFHAYSRNDASGKTEITIDKIEINQPLDEKLFDVKD